MHPKYNDTTVGNVTKELKCTTESGIHSKYNDTTVNEEKKGPQDRPLGYTRNDRGLEDTPFTTTYGVWFVR